MRGVFTFVALLCAVVAIGLSITSEAGYPKLVLLKNTLRLQKARNEQALTENGNLRAKVTGLRNDPRVLEKAARDELGMARPGEQVYFFEKQGR